MSADDIRFYTGEGCDYQSALGRPWQDPRPEAMETKVLMSVVDTSLFDWLVGDISCMSGIIFLK